MGKKKPVSSTLVRNQSGELRRLKRANSLEQKQHVRETIIAAGRRVFAEAALADVSVRRIATLASYSPGVVYQYFRDKRALLLAIGETDQASFADALEQTAARVKDPAQKVRAVFFAALRYWNEHYDQFQVLLGIKSRWGVPQPGEYSSLGQPPAAVRRAYRACQEPIRQLFKTYRRPPLPVRVATDTMIAAIAGVLFFPRQAAMPWSDTVAMGKWVINGLLSHWQQLAKRGTLPHERWSLVAGDGVTHASRQRRGVSGDRKLASSR